MADYVGPYSNEAYNAADMMAAGGAGTPYSAPIIAAGEAINTARSGGSYGGYTAPAPAYDPDVYEGWKTQKQNVYNTAYDAAGNAGIGIKNSILDFVDSLRSGQNKIESSAINNELARRQGAEGVQSMVGRGIRSGGVVLANKNASDSSAAGAIARAYGDIGRREMSNVGNQYEMGNRDIRMQQEDLDLQRSSGMRRIDASKDQVVNNIVADARNSLAALDAAAVDADLPDRIAIEREKNTIKERVLDQLGKYDAMLSEKAGSVRPGDRASRLSEATRLAGLGTAPEESFQFTSEMPMGQGPGPFASDIPLFTFRGRRQQG